MPFPFSPSVDFAVYSREMLCPFLPDRQMEEWRLKLLSLYVVVSDDTEVRWMLKCGAYDLSTHIHDLLSQSLDELFPSLSDLPEKISDDSERR